MRTPVATSVVIDPDKMRRFLLRHRMVQAAVGPALGLSEDWMASMLQHRRMNLFRLDDMAQLTGVRLDDLLDEVEVPRLW